MKDYCENEHCQNPGARVVPVSVGSPADQQRTLCTTCEEAYSWGVQHGTITAHQEVAVRHVENFMTAAGFVVLGRNQSDPGRDRPVEAWAYQGPLDFDVATPVVFGVGLRVRDALAALDLELADPKLNPGIAKGQVLGTVTTVQVDDRELATLLAALRYHQAENLAGDEGLVVDQAIQEIATDGGRLKPLTSGEIDQLCQRLNCGALVAVKPAGRGLTIDPPHREDGGKPLFRVVYTIDVNAGDGREAAKLADLTMTDPTAVPSVLQIMDHRGSVVTIDLSKKEPHDQKGGGP